MELDLGEPSVRAALTEPARWRLVASGVAAESERAPRRRAHATHAHGHREVMVALWGEAPYGLAGAAWRCPPGTWMSFAPFEEHDVGYPPGGDFGHLWISLVAESAFARLITMRRGRTEHGSLIALAPEAGAEATRALDEAGRLAPEAPALARSRALGACSALAAALLKPSAAARGSDEAQRQAIDAILRHIAATAGAGVSIAHLARIAGYSPFHFARVFRRVVGRTVHEYVDDCRRRTVEDLRRRGVLHRDIAQRLGFSCPSAFSRWLRANRPRS